MIQSKTISGQADGPHLLITAGVHGDEFEPMAAARALLTQLDARQLRGRVTIVPCVNEPAYERGQRVADDGLDLARVCPGDAKGSVTMRTAHALSALIRGADYYIDMHTGGSGLRLSPLSGYILHTNPAVLDAQRRMASAFNLPIIWGTHPAAEGRSLSVARDENIPAIYTETGGGGSCDKNLVDDCIQGCFNVMIELGMLNLMKPESRVQYVVEDPRDQSGHLQIQHPAPMAGFFDPSVALGDVVRAGDLIGTVCDCLGNRLEPVHADQAGVVLMLRWFRRVKQGDALAAILPTEYRRG